MEIVYVVDQFPKLSESFVINEISELQRRGHNISIFSIAEPDEKITHSEISDIEVKVHYSAVPSFTSFTDLFSPVLIDPSVLKHALFFERPLHYIYWLHLGIQIVDYIEDIGGIDHIHSHFAPGNRMSTVYAAAYHDIPCTATAHAYEVFAPDSQERLKRVCDHMDHIIVPSEYNRNYLRQQINVRTPISVVPATTNIEKFEPSKDCTSGRLLTVARLIEKKGYEYAIDAVADIVERGYDIEYHIIGTGELRDSLEARVRERGITDHVTFLGNVTDERLKTELHEAELFVLPCVIAENGDRDVAPVALKEAMATQTACISTTISAIPEMITDSYNGRLVEPNNTDALVNAITDLLDDSKKRKELAEAGRQTVEEKFDITSSVDKLLDIFRNIR